jgi:hypothetical protein
MDGSERRIKKVRIPYSPLPSQKKFHHSKARFKGFSGPIGSGKSQALCQEAIRMSYLNPGRLGFLGAPTYPMLRDATQATLLTILDDAGIAYDHNKAENSLVIRDTRSKILFRPTDDYERLRGTNLAWFGLDELTYSLEEAWLRMEGRLRDPKANRLCGFAVWSPRGYDWVYRKFIQKQVRGYDCVIAKPFENRHLLDQVPDFYKRLKDSYDPKMYAQEVLGEYLATDGMRVYTAFEEPVHVTELRIDPTIPLCWSLDFNFNPMTSIIAQRKGGITHVVDEIVLKHATTKDACDAFIARYGGHKAGVIVYGDASGEHAQTTGFSDFGVLRSHMEDHSNLRMDWRMLRSNPPVRERVNMTNAWLRKASGEVEMLIDPRCKELIEDFRQVCWRSTREIDKDRDRMRTHASDALGYLIWKEGRPFQVIGEQPRRLL